MTPIKKKPDVREEATYMLKPTDTLLKTEGYIYKTNKVRREMTADYDVMDNNYVGGKYKEERYVTRNDENGERVA